MRKRFNKNLVDGYLDLLPVCHLWNFLGRVWYGYEVRGMENLPDNGPCLIIYYHAAFVPVDMVLLVARLMLTKGRLIRCYVAWFL